MLGILDAILKFEDLRASIIDWVLSAELFYQQHMIMKITEILAQKISEGTLTQATMMQDPALIRLLEATQLAVVANFKNLIRDRNQIRDLFLHYNKLPIISVPLLVTMMKLADLKDWTDNRINVLRMNVSELDLQKIQHPDVIEGYETILAD